MYALLIKEARAASNASQKASEVLRLEQTAVLSNILQSSSRLERLQVFSWHSISVNCRLLVPSTPSVEQHTKGPAGRNCAVLLRRSLALRLGLAKSSRSIT